MYTCKECGDLHTKTCHACYLKRLCDVLADVTIKQVAKQNNMGTQLLKGPNDMRMVNCIKKAIVDKRKELANGGPNSDDKDKEDFEDYEDDKDSEEGEESEEDGESDGEIDGDEDFDPKRHQKRKKVVLSSKISESKVKHKTKEGKKKEKKRKKTQPKSPDWKNIHYYPDIDDFSVDLSEFDLNDRKPDRRVHHDRLQRVSNDNILTNGVTATVMTETKITTITVKEEAKYKDFQVVLKDIQRKTTSDKTFCENIEIKQNSDKSKKVLSKDGEVIFLKDPFQ
ncbi:DNA ligase 1-like, partial [Clytia hemisphaerica]|uniref:DNA ligase 1-like n=1 Tax=Clytia hemisphaerica TaxID=252671 RepID=UPI0034D6D10B